MLNTGLHQVGFGAAEVSEHATLLAQWLNTTQHDVIYRTSVPGHVQCELARAPLQSRYVAPSGHKYHWDDVEAHEAVRLARFEALIPGRIRYIDAATIANLRADRHMIQGRWGGGTIG